MKYFAYGSNMDMDDLLQWCDRNDLHLSEMVLKATAYIDNFRLSFNYYSKERKGGAANIMPGSNSPETNARTYGLLYEIDNKTREIIRKKEGFPDHYGEIIVCAQTADGITFKAMTYKVQKKREYESHQKPTDYYMNLIISNARKNYFPQDYISFLENIDRQVK